MSACTIAWGDVRSAFLEPLGETPSARACDVRDGGRRPRTTRRRPPRVPRRAARGLFHDATPGLAVRLATGRQIAAYNGFDPSGASLHIGHLVPITALAHLQRAVARRPRRRRDGMIGDPSGTSAERNLLDRETLEANLVGIRSELERFLSFEGPERPSWSTTSTG